MPDDLRAALTHWHITPDAVVASPHGTMNETFFVRLDGATRVLRRHRHLARSTVEREHEIIAFAVAGGIPTPPAIATVRGDVVVDSGGRLYSLFAHADGTQLRQAALLPEHARAMGTTLARLHGVLAGFPTDGPSRPDRAAAPPSVDRTLAALGDLLHTVEAWPAAGEQEARAASALRGQLSWVEHHRDELDATAAARPRPRQLIHGDYQHTNLFFADPGAPATGRESTVTAVIDWDKAEVADRAGELIRTIALSFVLDPALTAGFLAGYQRDGEMSLETLDAAAADYALGEARGTWLYDAIYRRGEDRCRQFLDPHGFRPFGARWSALRAALEAAAT